MVFFRIQNLELGIFHFKGTTSIFFYPFSLRGGQTALKLLILEMIPYIWKFTCKPIRTKHTSKHQLFSNFTAIENAKFYVHVKKKECGHLAPSETLRIHMALQLRPNTPPDARLHHSLQKLTLGPSCDSKIQALVAPTRGICQGPQGLPEIPAYFSSRYREHRKLKLRTKTYLRFRVL